jgi:hypothetical protein
VFHGQADLSIFANFFIPALNYTRTAKHNSVGAASTVIRVPEAAPALIYFTAATQTKVRFQASNYN